MLAVKRALGVAAATTAFIVAVGSAQAQSIVAFVNSEPITSYEVEQRARINRIARMSTARQSTLNELIDDKLKIAEARRIGYRIGDSNVDDQIARQAKSNGQTLFEFNQTLAKAGIDMNAYRDKLRANYAWELVMERRKGSTVQDPLFGSSGTGTGAKVTDYTLYSVIFVVPRGSAAGAKMGQANAARARFNDCSSGLAALRSMADVAVRPPISRSSDTINPQMNKLLAATPVNRLTQPFPSEQGVEMLAVCEKRERFDRFGKSDADAKKADTDATTFLKTLRSKAVIRLSGR